ncbi:MAG: electron transport complex subunit RsxC [Clostridia bacterium]|nr:electron transport complex subunit RsxC [Clostridia bacterium]
MAFTFHGGIHIDEHKTTRRCLVETMPPPKSVSIPLSQHIGAHAVPVVKVGDTVDKGQVIGVIEKGLGCPVHASVSGKVTAITEKNAANGMKIRNIVIANDGEERLSPDIKPWGKSLADTTTEEIIEIIRAAGISGMGGATFPTYAKIQSALGKVERIIVNCAECEPYITANHRLLLENPEAVINGLKILMKAFGLRESEIAVEDNKLDAINKLENRLVGSKMIHVRVLKTKYPQGDERQLIYALTGRELPVGKLPADVGCCVFNAETCAAIFNAFAEGMPLIERIVTVDGDCIKRPRNLLVPLGTSFTDIMHCCGGLIRSLKKIVSGGPMMGVSQWDKDGVVTKGTSAILFFSEKAENRYEQPPTCIRCGRCVRACPMRLMPNYLATFASQGKLEQCEEFDVIACVECGSCSYSCPGHVPIVQYIRAAKGQINDRKRAQAAALANSQVNPEKG